MANVEALVPISFNKIIKTFPKWFEYQASALGVMSEKVLQIDDIFVRTTLLLDIREDLCLYLCTLSVPLDRPDHFDSDFLVIDKVIAQQCPTECSIPEVLRYSVLALGSQHLMGCPLVVVRVLTSIDASLTKVLHRAITV